MDLDPDYFLDRYGICNTSPCRCLKEEWLGRLCPNWKPLGVRSHEELLQHFLKRMSDGY